MQDQIEELASRIDENGQSVSDLSDSTDSAFTDVQSTLDDHGNTISDLSNASGQLTFPLNQDTIDLIKEQFNNFAITGTITLSGGTASLTDSRILPASTVVFSIITASVPTVSIGATPFTLTQFYQYATITAGQVVFHSSASGDASKLNYIIIL